MSLLNSAGLGGNAIPDSAIEYWPCDEGSGQTLNNAITDNDVSLNFDRWSSNTEFEGGTAPDFQSADGDSGDATSNSAVQAFSFRIKLDDTSNRHHLFAHPDSGDDPRAYWKSVDSAWAFDSGGAQVDNATGDSNPTDIRIIICGSDGSNTYIYVYDKDGNLVTDANASGSLNAISDTETFNFGYLSGADNHDGELDQFYFHDQWLDSQQRTDLLNNYYL